VTVAALERIKTAPTMSRFLITGTFCASEWRCSDGPP
jgi:hypothetical protein